MLSFSYGFAIVRPSICKHEIYYFSKAEDTFLAGFPKYSPTLWVVSITESQIHFSQFYFSISNMPFFYLSPKTRTIHSNWAVKQDGRNSDQQEPIVEEFWFCSILNELGWDQRGNTADRASIP